MAEGAKFIAKVNLSNRAGELVAAAGQTCDAVDPNSLLWLLQQELIEAIEPAIDQADGKD